MNDAHKNGVAPKPKGRAFPLRLVSSELPGRIELGIALFVVLSVFVVSYLILKLPGPLVVQVHDDTGANVMGSRVTCTDARGSKEFSGITDVFGEAKWPGLEKGLWSCRALPPDRFQSAEQDGSAEVVSRSPATVSIRFDRPVHVNLEVKRPHGSPRAKVAVRALCPATQTAPESAWEGRASVLSGQVLLWLPFGRECRAGLVKPSLPEDGLVEHAHASLDCDNFPCTGRIGGASGASLDLVLEPTAAQWEAARPPIEAEPAEANLKN